MDIARGNAAEARDNRGTRRYPSRRATAQARWAAKPKSTASKPTARHYQSERQTVVGDRAV